MKYFLLNMIRAYWLLIPKSSRRKCIFHTSCSKFVYNKTQEHGIKRGLIALKFRFKNCRQGFDVFNDFETGETKMMLKSGQLVNENEIARRLL